MVFIQHNPAETQNNYMSLFVLDDKRTDSHGLDLEKHNRLFLIQLVLFIVIEQATKDKHRVISKFLRVKGEVFPRGNFALSALLFFDRI